MDKNGNYSTNEVATLVEDLKGEFRVVAEAVTGLRDDVDNLKDRMSAVELEVRTLKDVIKVELPAMNRRLSSLEAKVG